MQMYNSMTPLQTTTIQFPELHLFARDAHKLRGFFGTFFRERSTLLHNHFVNEHGEERLRYSYPLVQYKILQGTPMLLGLGEGSDVLADLFLEVRELNIGGVVYEINHKNIERANIECGLADNLHEYSFQSPWFALNQHNFDQYQTLFEAERLEMLNAILRGNILSFFKGVGIWLEGRVMTSLRVTGEVPLMFKDRTMTGFRASFTTNALLPEAIGLGKSVGRGFGTIQKP
jgi:hypothetical protein